MDFFFWGFEPLKRRPLLEKKNAVLRICYPPLQGLFMPWNSFEPIMRKSTLLPTHPTPLLRKVPSSY